MKMRSHLTVVVATAALLLMFCAGVASAQIDLSGSWNEQLFQDYRIRRPGPNYDDYLGIPLNATARTAATGYSPDAITQLYRQCQPWPIHYLFLGPFGLKIWSTLSPVTGAVVAWHLSGWIDRLPVTIWMDGRPHPSPLAQHTPAGFTTGKWAGDTLVTTTTNISDGYLTRNGVPSSNREKLTMFISRHGNLLTITGIIRDPVYLTAPYVLSRTWKYSPTTTTALGGLPRTRPMNCMPEEEDPVISNGHHVATLLPGNDYLRKLMLDTYHIPLDAIMGGAQTMYPWYQRKLRGYRPPAECNVGCCGWGNGSPGEFRVPARLHCKGGI